MSYRRLFLFVEGDDDERFFRSVVVPSLYTTYDDVQLVQFSRLKKDKVKGFLRSVAAMMADFILVHDLDRDPCATAAKNRLLNIHPQVDPDRIHIVKAEIESWYCAGIPKGHSWESLEIARCPETGTVTKETFEAVLLQKGQLRIPAMLDLLEAFDRETAARRNASFRRFLTKFVTAEP